MKRALWVTLLVQGGGGAATLVATLWIGTVLGPGPQGQFNQFKALVDLGAAVATLGLPQAIYVHAQSGRIGAPAARAAARRAALIGWPVGLGLAAWQIWSGAAVSILRDDSAAAGRPWLAWFGVLGLMVAVAMATRQAHDRALLLLLPGTARFNLATVAPQAALLALAAMWVMFGGLSPQAAAWGFAAVWLLAQVVTAAIARRGGSADLPEAASKRTAPTLSWANLWRHGLATWVAASLASLAVVGAQTGAERLGGPAVLGQLSLALLLAQFPLTPLNYAVPLLLKHRMTDAKWVGTTDRLSDSTAAPAPSAKPWTRVVVLLVLTFSGLAATVALVGRTHPELGMGGGYAGLAPTLAFALLAAGADAVLRLLAVEAQARGRPMCIAWAEGARVLLLAGLLLALAHDPTAQPQPSWVLAAAWMGAAFVALGVAWIAGRTSAPATASAP